MIVKMTSELRWLERDGKRVLQQKCIELLMVAAPGRRIVFKDWMPRGRWVDIPVVTRDDDIPPQFSALRDR